MGSSERLIVKHSRLYAEKVVRVVREMGWGRRDLKLDGRLDR